MFAFDYWFDGIVGTCRLIADDNAFMRAWVLGDDSLTSIHYYDELFEQLAGDLHLDESVERFASVLHDAAALEPVRTFAQTLHELDRRITDSPELQKADALLRSKEWRDFQLTAMRVLDLPIAATYARDVPHIPR